MAIKKTTATKVNAKAVKKDVAKKSIPTKTVIKTAPIKKVDTKTVVQNKDTINPLIYPIGKCNYPTEYNLATINNLIHEIKILPKHLKAILKQIDKKKELEYQYRENGWNIEQIVHHIADSHMNAVIRFKTALTENNPTIKPYDENLWAETSDIQLPLKNSFQLIKALHKKWTNILENMDNNDFKRTYFHPAYNKSVPLQEALALYAWHGKHHVAQIEVALKIN